MNTKSSVVSGLATSPAVIVRRATIGTRVQNQRLPKYLR